MFGGPNRWKGNRLMKALSIKDPWATLIWEGSKKIETRTWPTNHRGLLLICVSQRPASRFSGKAIAVANLVECREMVPSDEAWACCRYRPGLWSWIFDEVHKITPFPVRGQLGLFKVPYGVDKIETLRGGAS